MKYKNTQKAIIVIGDRESVQPFGITRDFSPKDIEGLPGIDAAVRRGYLVEYNGKEEQSEISASPRAAVWQTEMSSGKPVKKKLPGGGVVEYVVADAEGCDAVSMSDPDTVTSIEGKKSSDYIETGVDARQYKHRDASEAFDAEIDKENEDATFDDEETLAENEGDRSNILDVDKEISDEAAAVLAKNGKPVPTKEVIANQVKSRLAAKKGESRNASDAFDAEIDKENLDASFDDEDTLAENEGEHLEIPDADDEIAKDSSQVLVNGGKAGAKLKNVMAVVEESTAKALGELSNATRPDYDEAEMQAGVPGKVVDFLKQNFSSKKWVIAKETDANFLHDVQKVTQSENVRSLVEQRLAELEKPQ